jgi:hypothetical protein
MPNDLGMRDPYPAQKEGALDREKELRRVLVRVPVAEQSTAARYFRLGWNRLAQLQAPILRRWEESFWRQGREIDLLRAQIGQLISRVSRLEDRG